MEPKRILALDGGGIRGVFSLQILSRIEQILREAHARPALVLADVFDLFAGTSTGAIIAAFLAWGASVREVESLYLEHGREMFARQSWFLRWKCKYRAEMIARYFRESFAESDGTPALLQSKRLRKLLIVVMRNATTGSPWPISSNPEARFNDPSLSDCNLNVPLWQLLRASTAAPTFFPPEEIALGNRKFLFVDGGVTPYNNPSLLAVMMATLPCYRLYWPASRQSLHLVSVGTGHQHTHLPHKLARNIDLLDQLKFVIPAVLGAVSVEQDILCRILGDCLHGSPIDSEIGRLDAPSLLDAGQQKFSYARYNCEMDSSEVGEPMTPTELQMDNLKVISRLRDIGRAYAEANVRPEHLWPRGQAPA